MKRFHWVTLFLILGLGLGLGVHQTRASQPEPLARQTLPQGLFPQEFRQSEGPITSPEDITHPLNVENLNSRDHPSVRFLEGYRVVILVWDGQYNTLVAHYLYRYANEDQARQAAETLVREWKLESGLDGWTFKGFDSEGGALYNWLQVRGDVLSLLIVNGMPTPSSEKIFERAVQVLSTLR